MQLEQLAPVIRYSPPLPPLPKEKSEGSDRSLTAVLAYNGKKYSVDCLSRKYTSKFRFHEVELGNVVFDEDGSTLEYSEKQLDLAIYDSLRRFIRSWEKSFPEF